MLLKSLVLVPLLANQAWATCNKDNLLNAFVKSSSQAAAFCSTYHSGSPLPTFVPTTYPISRYTSACSCIATTAAATTTTTSKSSSITTTKPTTTSCVCPVCDPFFVTVTVSKTQSASTVTSTVTVTQTSSIPHEVDFTTTRPASTVTVTAACPSSSTTSTSTSTAPSCPSPSFSCSGSCKDLTSDPNNCGNCGLTCSLPNAVSSCTNSQCAIASCNVGFGNCDGIPQNGCETNTLFSTNNCGTCGSVCTFPNGLGLCQGGTCQLSGCKSGFQNCNGAFADGCETNTFSDPSNCGACAHQCSSNGGTPLCSAGNCDTICAAGRMNCNGNPNDGCETNTSTDKNNCGGCGNVCQSGLHPASCVNGICQS